MFRFDPIQAATAGTFLLAATGLAIAGEGPGEGVVTPAEGSARSEIAIDGIEDLKRRPRIYLEPLATSASRKRVRVRVRSWRYGSVRAELRGAPAGAYRVMLKPRRARSAAYSVGTYEVRTPQLEDLTVSQITSDRIGDLDGVLTLHGEQFGSRRGRAASADAGRR